MRKILIGAALCLGSPVVAQEDTRAYVVDMMQAVCGVEDGKNQGKVTKATFDASAELRLKGVLKHVAKAGLEGAASYDTTEYINGLANDALAGELKSIRDCNMRVYNDFSPVLVKWLEAKSAGGGSVNLTATGDCNAQVGGGGNTVTVNCDAGN